MMDSKMNLSRRQFIGIAGGIAGAAAVASFAFDAPAVVNKPTIDGSKFIQEKRELDVLVIGGGMADKQNASMSIDEFVAKVSESAIQTNNPVFTRQLAEHSQARVEELKEWGFFDSPLYNHSFMRPINERNIPLEERIMITHLLKQDGRIVGASGFSLDENKVIHYQAKAVILCTGSGGFKPNGFPMCDLTHDGTIMAYKAGAKVTGKEWNDGHPGSAVNSGSSYDNWHGQVEEKPSTTSITINHHLGMDLNYEGYKYGAPVTMGPPMRGKPGEESRNKKHVSSESLIAQLMPAGPYTPEAFRMTSPPPPPEREGFLMSLLAPKGHSGPPGMGGEQVGGSSAGMAIHKAEGIVPINEQGLSTLPGLYAAGDALGSYMSGGIYTQIGSSLAGSAVQGAIAGEAAAKESLNSDVKIDVSAAYLTKVSEEILAPLQRKRGYSPAWVTQVLQSVMIPNFVLYIKKERMMQGALAYIEELRDHHVPMLLAKDLHSLRLAHETENMIITAEMKLRASMMRKESRCSHYRLDYPEIDYKNWQAWININQDENGEMRLEKQGFDQWPAFS